MTIKELYEWAVKHGVENYEVLLSYRDGGGFYYGFDYAEFDDIEVDNKMETVKL